YRPSPREADRQMTKKPARQVEIPINISVQTRASRKPGAGRGAGGSASGAISSGGSSSPSGYGSTDVDGPVRAAKRTVFAGRMRNEYMADAKGRSKRERGGVARPRLE